jgi:5,10-methylenetetrahydrofolate reductase
MFISVEQTASQTLPAYVVKSCDQITITHLPTQPLTRSIDAVKKINDEAGVAKAVPHIAARNLNSEAELLNSCQCFEKEGVDTVLIIGGDRSYGVRYTSVYQICQEIKIFPFRKMCGVYPQKESISHVKKKKYTSFLEGVTQFCLKPDLLNEFQEATRIGVPSNCSIQKLIKFAKICGANKTFQIFLENLSGVKFINANGFDTKHFVNCLTNQRIHIYNFGRIEQTVRSLLD